MADVIFCRPPGTSETVCHNLIITNGKPPPSLPPIFNDCDQCGLFTTTPPTPDNMTTSTVITTVSSKPTTPPEPAPDLTITIVIIICIILLILLVILIIRYIYNQWPFKGCYRPDCLKTYDRSKSMMPGKQDNQPDELKFHSLNMDTKDNGTDGIGNATAAGAGTEDPERGMSPLGSPDEDTILFPVPATEEEEKDKDNRV